MLVAQVVASTAGSVSLLAPVLSLGFASALVGKTMPVPFFVPEENLKLGLIEVSSSSMDDVTLISTTC